MPQPDRNFDSQEYRYGFQGQEKDSELKGEGLSVNYKYRMHDPRVGRFFTVDPMFKDYPWNSTYAFSENDVIASVELEGLEKVPANEVWDMGHDEASATDVGKEHVDTNTIYKGHINGDFVNAYRIVSGANTGNYVAMSFGDYYPGSPHYIIGADKMRGNGFNLNLTTGGDFDKMIQFNTHWRTLFSSGSMEHVEPTNALFGLIENEGQQAYVISYDEYLVRGWDASGNPTMSFEYEVTNVQETWESHTLNLGVYSAALTELAALKLIKLARFAGGIKYSDDLVKEAQKLYPNKAGKVELHHPFPKYMGGAEKQALVPIDAAYHQVITNEFYKYWPKKVPGKPKVYPTAAQAKEIMKKVYDKYPLPPSN